VIYIKYYFIKIPSSSANVKGEDVELPEYAGPELLVIKDGS
jgi:hypothetical protein